MSGVSQAGEIAKNKVGTSSSSSSQLYSVYSSDAILKLGQCPAAAMAHWLLCVCVLRRGIHGYIDAAAASAVVSKAANCMQY